MYNQVLRREEEIPRCPFCREPFRRPPASQPREEGNFYKWTCSCRAVGVFDSTGSNLGEALLEALVLAGGDDWDQALMLEENKDYQIKHLEGYSPQEHRVRGGRFTYKSGRGAFIFIKLAKNF
jgi:hypothetical protein